VKLKKEQGEKKKESIWIYRVVWSLESGWLECMCGNGNPRPLFQLLSSLFFSSFICLSFVVLPFLFILLMGADFADF